MKLNLQSMLQGTVCLACPVVSLSRVSAWQSSALMVLAVLAVLAVIPMLLQPATTSVLAIGRGGLGAGFCFCGRRHATQPGCAKPDDPLAPIGVDGILYVHACMCMHVPCMCMELQFLIHTRVVTVSPARTRSHAHTHCSKAFAHVRHGQTGERLPAECVPACAWAPLCLRLGGGGRDAAAMAPARFDVIPLHYMHACIHTYVHTYARLRTHVYTSHPGPRGKDHRALSSLISGLEARLFCYRLMGFVDLARALLKPALLSWLIGWRARLRPSPACVSVYVYMTHMTPHTQEHANTTHVPAYTRCQLQTHPRDTHTPSEVLCCAAWRAESGRCR